jgi:[ribosomal protein S5]-alanine N-acetyltransferase
LINFHHKKHVMEKTITKFKIDGDIVSLRLFRESDISNIFVSWLNDKKVVKYSNQRFLNHTHKSCLDYLRSFSNAQNIYWAIEDKKTKELYGSITAYIQDNHSTADIGLMVGNKNAWGKGVGFDAWRLMMDFLFTQYGIRKVTGGALRANVGMICIMKKSKMTHEATRKDHELINGEPMDILYFCKFNNDR